MWHFEFEAPVGSRILRNHFFGIQLYSNTNKWFVEAQNKWLPVDDIKQGFSNTAKCSSFKAFKRHLRNHPELQECEGVVLQSRFYGYNIIARWVPQ